MPITLNHSNINVQYSSDKSYIIETVKSDLYVRDSRIGISSNLTAEPAIIAPTFTETFQTFQHSGGSEAQTSYSITIGQNTICDILVIAGGGGGGKRHAGGGGAGTLLYHKNVILNGTYNIKVGKGGAGATSSAFDSTGPWNGEFSQFVKSDGTQNYYATGGGRGTSGGYHYATTNGGQGYLYDANLTLSSGNIFNGVSVAVSNKEYVNTLTSPEGCRGRIGGTQINNYKGGGGGGAGGVGMNHAEETTINDGYGGIGLAIDITGTSVVYAGGGGGSDFSGSVSQVFDPAYPTIQSRGGGGYGSDNGAAQNGLDGTGGGGGGQGNDTTGNNGGKGGSGIVIIRFKTIVNSAIPEGNPITHKTLNFTYEPKYPIIQADTTNLKAWYKFDGNYMDSSSSGFNLTNSGAVIVNDLIVQSVSTDGSDFLETSGINLNGKTYSISFWAKFNTAPSGNNIPLFTQGVTDSTSTRLIFLYESTGNNLRFSHYGSGNDIDTTGYNMTNVIGTSWHHYVVTYNNTNRGAEIWFDGVKLNTNVSTLANTFTGSGSFTIARWQGITFNGLMEDFRYYDKILTSAEISQLYNIPLTNQYTLDFPVPTTTDILERTAGRGILNNSNLILQGTYDINLTASAATIVPRTGQYLPFTATSNLSQNIGFRYHLLNPIKMPEGAQWTYSSNNTNVYHMGSVGIGTTSPEYHLDVRGTIFSSTGGYTQTGLTTWSIASDRRIKENIVKASYEKCLENVKNIELYNFNFKDNYVITNDRRQLGFIAQEIQQVYPKAVEVSKMILNLEEKIDDLLTLNTTQIDYTLYGAVKGLIHKMENIKTKMEQIKGTSNITTQA